ncbi:MAG: membrane protein insertion efficiency factor YidD [Clostridia bacterium]|nr:membrane protein insertion efficiency factor YidD [Clostridia bacterium]
MIKKGMLFLIMIYQKGISPLLPPRCRFYPTCSQYAKETLEKKGIVKGILLIIWRIMRCNPFNPGGYDPVK